MRDCQHQTQITNNFELFSQSKQQQLRAASTTNYVGPTATAVGWPLYADVQSIIIMKIIIMIIVMIIRLIIIMIIVMIIKMIIVTIIYNVLVKGFARAQ